VFARRPSREVIEIASSDDEENNIPEIAHPVVGNAGIGPSSNHISSPYVSFDSGNRSFIFSIQGNPCPLARNRFFNRGLYGPSQRKMGDFIHTMRCAMQTQQISLILYPIGTPVTVTVWFYTKRPLHHFVANRRAPHNLKSRHNTTTWHVTTKGPDVDNLSKFVLDAMNKIVYHDDGQVVNLVAYKLLDSIEDCLGRTVIQVKPTPFYIPQPPLPVNLLS